MWPDKYKRDNLNDIILGLCSACPKSPVSDKKTPFSALRLSENSSFTLVNCGFSDFASLENELFLSDTM
jgi:hypothetical protein